MKLNEFDLRSIENYDKTITNDEDEIYLKYTIVIIQYLMLGIEKIKNQNSEYVKYILIKGIFTISYVFKMLLMYTCNLHLTYHHCQKSYSYYIEFIGQIGDDAVTYLQLNSKDAALFVYKKSIFDILDEIKKKDRDNETNEKIKNVSIMIDIYNKLIETEITYLDSKHLKNTEFINKLYFNLECVNAKLFKLYSHYSDRVKIEGEGEKYDDNVTINENNKNMFFIKIMYTKVFCDIVILKKSSNTLTHENDVDIYRDYIKIIEYFIKKIRKINDLPNEFKLHLISKSFSDQFEKKIKLYNSSKFVNWIFT